MLKSLEQISTESKFVNPFWEYRVDNYKMPSGKISEYHYVNSRGATIIIPITKNNKYLMVEQYRYLNQRISIEFPGGGIKANISPLDNAKKELTEETGYESTSIKLIGRFNPYNGVTNEICFVFIADDLIFYQNKPEESEEFELLELTKQEINDKINSGVIWDGMTLAAWTIYLMSSEKI